MTNICGFSEAWAGTCKKPAPCSEHMYIKCRVCGAVANRTCSHTAGLVCGTPLCAECTAVNEQKHGHGFMRFGGHFHIRRQEGHSLVFDKETTKISCTCGWIYGGSFDDYENEFDEHLLAIVKGKGEVPKPV